MGSHPVNRPHKFGRKGCNRVPCALSICAHWSGYEIPDEMHHQASDDSELGWEANLNPNGSVKQRRLGVAAEVEGVQQTQEETVEAEAAGQVEEEAGLAEAAEEGREHVVAKAWQAASPPAKSQLHVAGTCCHGCRPCPAAPAPPISSIHLYSEACGVQGGCAVAPRLEA